MGRGGGLSWGEVGSLGWLGRICRSEAWENVLDRSGSLYLGSGLASFREGVG